VSAKRTEFLTIGEILKPWGYRGEVKVKLLTDFPKRVAKLKTVYVGNDTRAISLERARLHSGFALFKFSGYDSPESVAKLRGELVQIPLEDAATLRKGQYYHHQIIGLDVWTTSGERLGTVEEILETGANDVYVVTAEGGREILIPAIQDVVREIDLDGNRIVIDVIPGLIDEEVTVE
jgi:16S rRNA processing protein RimM